MMVPMFPRIIYRDLEIRLDDVQPPRCVLDPVTYAVSPLDTPKNDRHSSTIRRRSVFTDSMKARTAANHATMADISNGNDGKLSAPVTKPHYAFLNAAPVPVLPSAQRTVNDTKQGQIIWLIKIFSTVCNFSRYELHVRYSSPGIKTR